MVEHDAIYEEINERKFRHHSDANDDQSNFSNGRESADDEANFTRNSIYEDMNGVGEELAETYNIQNVHYRQNSDGLLILQKRPIYADVKSHSRNSSSSSEEEHYSYKQRQKIYQRLGSRSADQINRIHPLQDYERETIYTEIVTNPGTMEITAGRITRESQNPILQQNKVSDSFYTAKAGPASKHEITVNGLYGYIANRKQIQSRELPDCEIYENSELFVSQNSNNGDKELYENSRPPTMTGDTNNENGDEELYENSRPPTMTVDRNNKNCSSPTRHDTFSKCNQILRFQKDTQQDTFSDADLARSTESVTSLYKNVAEHTEHDIYENVSEQDWGEISRGRSSSKPINIFQKSENTIEFANKKLSSHPFSFSSMSSSVTSSPRGSICSSISSDQTRSLSPPPLFPLSKRKQKGTSSWSDLSTFRGLNYYAANYLGKQQVTKLTKDCIDEAVSYVAQRTNLLEMKPVVTEVNHEMIRIGSNSSPWELFESFLIEEIMNFEVIKKNVAFLGIIAGRPGDEAYCYVLQSDKASDIGDSIREVFQTDSRKKLSKSRSTIEVSNQFNFHRFNYVVKVGSTKVRQSFRCVNEYIKLVLEKVNPKDFRSVNLEVMGPNVVITDAQYDEEVTHSTPSILSLGVYSGDKRYFGYIITEILSSNKQRVQCHVYRAARNSTAANIIDAISTSYQSAYSPRNSDQCDMNPIYSPTYGIKSNNKTSNSPISPTTNPIYSKFPNTRNTNRSTASEESNGRNSITSVSSNTTTSIGSLNYSIHSSPDVSPSSTMTKRRSSQGTSSLFGKLNNFRTSAQQRLSMNVECLSENQKDRLMDLNKNNQKESENDLLIDLGSTETLLTLTPNSPCSTSPIARSSPTTRRERPKSLPLLDSDDVEDGRFIEDFQQVDDDVFNKDGSDSRKSKSKKLFNKFCGSIREKLNNNALNTPAETPTLNGNVDSFNFIEKPTLNESDIISTTYTFKVMYICSTLVKPPLRPKHVRECFKQFTKEIHKAEKLSHNNGTRVVGTPIELVIVTDTEIMMLDPQDPSNIIRQCSIDLYERCVLHPDDNQSCFAFSTTVPGNQQKHKIHLFTLTKELKPDIIQAFGQLEENKCKLAQCVSQSIID